MERNVKTKKEAKEHIEERIQNIRKHCLSGLRNLKKGESLMISSGFEINYNA